MELKTFAAHNCITLEIGLRGIIPKNLETYIEISHQLDVRLLRCVIDAPGFTPEFSQIHTILNQFLPLLKEHNIVLGIENHDRFTTAEFAEVIEKLDDPHYGIVLDTVNSLANEESVEQVLNNLARYTVCFHVKDYQIVRNPYGMGLLVTGTPSGKGRLDIKSIIERLRNDAQQDFSTIIELWMDREHTEGESLHKEEVWAKESISYMKEVFAILPNS
ncbi:hypothetical protein SDC9_155944 [bioreactor metagenome]|uniref:Xylose isomerase-like TIM barrel domain-containing protein n=1 Tax=bioreactor metagenome TaxID=1076179 RepID=A0A645F5G1_9ZZZZ